MRRQEQLNDLEASVTAYREALEQIVCMQEMHEGSGGCHGPCPVCRAASALGLHKYLRNPGDKVHLLYLKQKYGYITKEEYEKAFHDLAPAAAPAPLPPSPCELVGHTWFGSQCTLCRQFKPA